MRPLTAFVTLSKSSLCPVSDAVLRPLWPVPTWACRLHPGSLQPGPRALQPHRPWSSGPLQAASLPLPGASPTFSCCKTLRPSLNGLAGGDPLQGAVKILRDGEPVQSHLEVGRMTYRVRASGVCVFAESCSQAPGQAGTWGGGPQSCPQGMMPPCRLGGPLVGLRRPPHCGGRHASQPLSLRVCLPRRLHGHLL